MKNQYVTSVTLSRSSIFKNMRGSREGTGGPDLENHNDIGFLSNTGPDPLKNH